MSETPHKDREPYTGEAENIDDGSVEGFDPAVARELGIPIDDESYLSQIESAKEVQRLLSGTALRAVDGAEEHAKVVAEEGFVRCATCNKPSCSGCGR